MRFNAIAYAQFCLRGGARGIWLASVAYFLALSLGVAIVYSSTEPLRRADAFSELAAGLIALQSLLFLMYGIQTTSVAVKGDITSGMMESHRLMPISAGNAVLGYLGGAPCQAYALFLANSLLGAVLYVLVPNIRMPIYQAILVNCVLFVLGLFLFATSIFWSLLGRNVGRYFIGLVLVYWISRGELFTYIPGVAFLVSPVLWMDVWAPPDWVFGVAMGAQVCVGAVLLIAAARKYRYPALPAFTPLLGLIFVGIVTAIFGTAIHVSQITLHSSGFWVRNVDIFLQFSCSIILLIWLGMIPIGAAIRRPGRWMHPLVVAVLTSLICAALLVLVPDAHGPAQLWIVMIVFIFEMTLVYLFRFLMTLTPRASLLTFALLAIYSGTPFIVDAFRYSSSASGSPYWTRIATLSPIGSLILVWKPPGAMTAGVLFQTVVLIFVVVLFYFFRRRPIV